MSWSSGMLALIFLTALAFYTGDIDKRVQKLECDYQGKVWKPAWIGFLNNGICEHR